MTKKIKIELGSIIIAAENLDMEKQDIQDILYQIAYNMKRSQYDDKDIFDNLNNSYLDKCSNTFLKAMDDLDMFNSNNTLIDSLHTFDINKTFKNDLRTAFSKYLIDEIAFNITNYTEEQKLSAYDDYDMKVFE